MLDIQRLYLHAGMKGPMNMFIIALNNPEVRRKFMKPMAPTEIMKASIMMKWVKMIDCVVRILLFTINETFNLSTKKNGGLNYRTGISVHLYLD
jgi:hypothetical protein